MKNILQVYSKYLLSIFGLLLTVSMLNGQAIGDYGSNPTTLTSGYYLTATANNWVVCTSAGTWAGATTAATAPGGSVNIFIRNGHTIALGGSTSYKNVTIESGGSLISNAGGSAGSPRGLRVNGTILQVDGTLGGTSDATAQFLSIEPQAISGTVTVQGSGTCYVARARPSAAGTTGVTLRFNMPVTFTTTNQAFSTNGADNTTFEVNSTITSAGYIGVSNNATSDPSTGANMTVNVKKGGVLNTTASTSSGNLNLSNTAGKTTTFKVFDGGSATFGGSFVAPSTSAATAMNLIIENGSTLTFGGTITATGTTVEYQVGSDVNTGSSNTLTTLTSVKNLTINNAAGVTLTSAATVSGTLTFTNGKISLGANNLTVGTISGASSSKYIVTNGAGTLTQTFSSATLFPIGQSASIYDPVTITPTASATFSVKASGSFANAPANVAKLFPTEWNITPSASATADLILTPGSTAGGSFDAVNAKLGHYTGTAWEELAANYSGGTFTATAVSSFSPFGTGSTGAFDAPLPVELLGFAVKNKGNANILTWKTSSEKENMQFNIERSADGVTFATIGLVKGNGTSYTENAYTYTDATPLSISYYRLAQVDANGNINHSKVVSIRKSANQNILKVYPTIANDVLNLEYTAANEVQIHITDVLGRVVSSQQMDMTNGVAQIPISTLPKGTYHVIVLGENGRNITKFVKE